MLKFLVIVLTFLPFVLSAQLEIRSELGPRQDTCPANSKSCGSGCIPQTGTCCDTYYCPSPRQCDGQGGCTCLSTEKSCGKGCIPSDAVCCTDEKYCDPGEFCAPVVGYCCSNGEDPATCAVRQSFTLPASAATSTPEAASTFTPPTTNISSTAIVTNTTATVASTTSVAEFTGAARRKDSTAGVILGALGLIAAL